MKKARFVLSRSKVIEQYEKLKNLGILISYSVKTNPIVAGILEEKTDSYFTVDNIQSLDYVKDKKRVWFMLQGVKEEDMEFLFSRCVKRFIVDNEFDLKTLLTYIRKRDESIDLLLRMKVREHTIFTGRYFVFGMDSKKVNEWLSKLRGEKNIKTLGIHFHRKTQNVSEWSLIEELSESVRKDVMEGIDMVNMGGGFPVRYKNVSDSNLDHIFKKVAEFRNWLSEYDINLMAEPGRFIAAPSVKLETYIKLIIGRNIIVDCSVYNSAMDTLIEPLKLLVEGELERGESYTIKGCTPCPMDIFRYNVKLRKPKVGDKIIFLNAGAYNFSTDFCNLEKLETVIVD
ncbi:MAG TPA: decarboxylase [Candidatus Aenigmarchaeota archaeon]|nr:decarboxylase [Candidatus Aenigmarchaeota archaeon]